MSVLNAYPQYFYNKEQFDPALCGVSYFLEENNTLLINKQTSILTATSAYLSKVVESGLHRWQFKFAKYNSATYYATIAVWKTKWKPNLGGRMDQASIAEDKSYGWIISHKKLAISGVAYGEKRCREGDTIEMILDLDERTLSYSVNDESYGIAYKDIEITSYRAVVSTNNRNDQIKFISYSSDCVNQ